VQKETDDIIFFKVGLRIGPASPTPFEHFREPMSPLFLTIFKRQTKQYKQGKIILLVSKNLFIVDMKNSMSNI